MMINHHEACGGIIIETMSSHPTCHRDACSIRVLHHIVVVVVALSGCFCNPGGCQELLGLTSDDVQQNYRLGRICSDDGHDVVNNRHTGTMQQPSI